MEIALFWPNGGYYNSPGHIGTRGDFYTSPSAHPAFGALLCLQTFQMWQLLGCPNPFWVVEVGAGSGLLCHDLLSYSLHLPFDFQQSLRYLCLERWPFWGAEVGAGLASPLPSETGSLGENTRGRIDRVVAHNIPLRQVKGCFLSNELIDCFPVHRVTMQGGKLLEVYVTLQDEKFLEVVDSPSTPAFEDRLRALGISLSEGFCAEVNLAMEPWLQEVASALEQGFVITVDYGHPAMELYSYHRPRGSLTCFYKHTQTDNPYLHIGHQDMTAQVDFTSLINLGESYGLELLGFTTQRQFLTNLGIQNFIRSLATLGLKQREVEANRLGMLDLTRPGGLGDFKVLVQGKGVGRASLWGFEKSPELEDLANAQRALPLLTPRHMPLLEGRYPHLAFDWETLWPSSENNAKISS